ncbi:MAG: type II secretion system F family protein [Aeromicrobium sp.]
MAAALCLGIAVFLAVRRPPQSRCRRIFRQESRPRPTAPAPTVIAASFAGLACLTLFGFPTGLLVAAFAMPVAARVTGRLESASVRRRRFQLARQLPGAIDLLVAVLDSGRPPAASFSLVARATSDPLGFEFRAIAGRLSITGDEQAVWEGLRSRPEFAALARGFGRASRSGMPVGKVLERLAEELRRERRAAAQERARSVAVATAAPLGLCFLPAFFLIGIVPTLLGAFSTFSW